MKPLRSPAPACSAKRWVISSSKSSSALSLKVAEARLCSSQSVLERLGAHPGSAPGASGSVPGASRERPGGGGSYTDGITTAGEGWGEGGGGKIMKNH